MANFKIYDIFSQTMRNINAIILQLYWVNIKNPHEQLAHQ